MVLQLMVLPCKIIHPVWMALQEKSFPGIIANTFTRNF
jgi:hypothetical protein